MDIKQQTEMSILLAASMLLYLTEFYVMPVLSFLFIVAPVPFLIMQRRFGSDKAAFAAVLSALFFAITSCVSAGGFDRLALAPATVFFFLFAFEGIVLGVCVEEGETAEGYMYHAVAASVMTKVFAIISVTALTGVNPFIADPGTTEAIAAMINTGRSAAEIKKYSAELTAAVNMLMPSMVICFSAAGAFLSYVAAGRILNKYTGRGFAKFPPFEGWRLPKNIGYAIFAALIFTLLEKSFPQNGFVKVVSVNLLAMLRAIFTLEGLAVCWYFIGRKVPRGLKTALKIVLIAALPAASYMLSLLGIFDIWYDLRKFGGNKL